MNIYLATVYVVILMLCTIHLLLKAGYAHVPNFVDFDFVDCQQSRKYC